MIDLLIRNGLVVTPDAIIPADIAVENEKILGIGSWGTFQHAKHEYDAQDKLVLPGLIDPHVHMAHPFRGELSTDGFYSTTVSASFGGTTTIIDFAIQWDKKLRLRKCVNLRREQADDEVVIDYALHAVPTKSTEETLREARYLVSNGVVSFKIYMVYRRQGRMVDDAILHGLLSELRGYNGILMVHAENSAMAEFNEQLFQSRGQMSAADFPLVKPNIVEAEAINRVLYLNRQVGGRLYIVHLSTREGLELVEAAIANGDSVFAETCPHYLTLSKDVYKRQDGARFICSPPLREQVDIDALWNAVTNGTISTIASDHCGFGKEQKDKGKGDFSQTPHGLPGIETRLPVVYTEGVLKNRISVNRMVELLSTNPAKIFGLYPRKGALLPGSDADIVIVDTDQERVLRGEEMHGAVKWSPYEGMKLHGFACATISQGKVIVDGDEFLGSRGAGRYLERRT